MALAAAPPALWHNHSDPFSQKQFPCALDPKAVAMRMFELHCGAPEIGPPWLGMVTEAGVKLGELSGPAASWFLSKMKIFALRKLSKPSNGRVNILHAT